MSDSLIIEGKQYISSRRAAEIAGYSNDYVGQLCRSGKLVCRMIGRFWYVDQDSILRHQKESMKPNQTVFKKADFLTSSIGQKVYAGQSMPVASQATIIQPPPGWKWRYFDKPSPLGVSTSDIRFGLIASVAAVMAILAIMIMTGIRSPLSQVGISSADVLTAAQSAKHEIFSIWNSLSSGVVSLASRFHPTVGGSTDQYAAANQPVEEPPASSVIPLGQAGKVTAEHGGLVILPQEGSSSDQAKLEESIQNSFSDTVVVKPNADGTTGVIKPVFRTVAGHDFLYVLVPVKATSTEPTAASAIN